MRRARSKAHPQGSLPCSCGRRNSARPFLRRFFRQSNFCISLPQIKPIVLTMLVLSVIDVFNMFDNVQIMTGGGPSGAPCYRGSTSSSPVTGRQLGEQPPQSRAYRQNRAGSSWASVQ